MTTFKHSISPLVALIGLIALPVLVWAATSAVTITTVDNTGSVGTHSSVKIDSNGFPIISYYDSTNTNLKVAKCQDSSCAANTTLTTVDNTGVVGTYTSLAIDSNGLPVIAYFDDSNDDLKVAKCMNSGCTTGTTISTVDSTGAVGTHLSLAIDSNNFPVISYYDDTNDDLKVAKCMNSGCTASTAITTVDSTGVLGTFTSIAIDSNGFPVISYYDNSNSDLKVAKCMNSGCTTGTTISTVDSTGDVGTYSAIAVDSNNFPVIGYYDNTNDDLKVAKCMNSGCTVNTTLTAIDTDLPSFFLSATFTSIAIDSNGLPVLSYYDLPNEDVNVAKCANSGCTTGTTINIVDSTGDVGWYTSLALDSNDYPIISYFDDTNDDLKVADCLNTFCAAPAAPTVLSPSNGASVDITTTLSGTGSAVGNYIRVTNKHSRTICTAPVQSGLTWSCTTKPLNQSETLTIIETDSLGFESDSTTLTLRVTLPAANAPGQSSGGGGGGGARSSTLSRRMNTVESTTTHAAASTQETSTESTDPTFKVRVCNRVMNRFATDSKMTQRVNIRLNERFGFICN